MADEENPFGEEFGKRFFEQAFELWINPELRRREADGRPIAGEPHAIQVIWQPKGDLEVRFNEEVRGYAWTRLGRPVEKGEPVYFSDLDGFQAFDLLDDELDCQHVTLIRTSKGWSATFNFLTLRRRGLALLEKAAQFLEAAKDAALKAHGAVAVDNLFSACELIAKADLMTSHAVEGDASTHGRIQSQLNIQRRMGNVDAGFVELFNRLSRLRPFYRYASEVSDQHPVAVDDCELVEAMLDRSRSKLARKMDKAVEEEAKEKDE